MSISDLYNEDFCETGFFDVIESLLDYRGKTPLKLGMSWSDVETPYLALSALNVKDNGIDTTKEAHYGTADLYKKWMKDKPLREQQILMTTEAPAGVVMQIPDNRPYILSQRVIALNVDPTKVDECFFAYLLRSHYVQNQIERLCSGGTAKGISQKHLKEIKVRYPKSIKTQQKIAEFFTALDEKIHSIENKLSLLDRTKKYFVNALLQKKLRFVKDNGSTYTDWVSCNVANIADVIGGGTPSTTDEAYWNGDINWFTPAEINSKYLIPSKRKISKLGLDNSSAKLLPKNSLLLTTRASLGLCSINSLDSFVCTNQGFQSLICKENAFHEFVYYMVTSDAFKKELKTKASGSTFLEVSSASLKSIKIEIPCYEEQIKIANFISQMDLKIELLVKQKKVFEKMKKAFMQRMFV